MRRRPKFVGGAVVLFGIVFIGVGGLLITVLWNVLMPQIFGLPAIGFWQALGLFLLSRILFGRFGPLHRWGGPRFARGWKNLTPEERERFREAMGRHHRWPCGEEPARPEGETGTVP